jgi:hypothetical protein
MEVILKADNMIGNYNKLKENKNPRVISDLIQSAKDKMGTVLIWIMQNDVKVTCEMVIHIIRNAKQELILKPIMDQKDLVHSIVGGREEINVFIPGDLVFFQSNVKSLSGEGELVISMPTMVAHVDRRKHLRINVLPAMGVESAFYKSFLSQRVNTQLFKKNCLDLGTGGLSFVISKMENKYFNIGDRVVGIILQLGDKKIEVDASIVNILPITPDDYNKLYYKGLKVCLKFDYVNPIYQEMLEMFVFKYFKVGAAA